MLISIFFNLSACKNATKDAFAFREIAFCAEVEWEENGEKYCARIYNEPSQKLRIFALDTSAVAKNEKRYAEYVLPSELEGIKVEQSSERAYEISLSGASVSSEGIGALALPLKLIFEQGSGLYVGEGVVSGVRCRSYSTSGALGNATYFIDAKTKLPKRIAFDNIELDFVWIELIGE